MNKKRVFQCCLCNKYGEKEEGRDPSVGSIKQGSKTAYFHMDCLRRMGRGYHGET